MRVGVSMGLCSTFVCRKEQGVSNDDVDHIAVSLHCTGSIVVAAMELGGSVILGPNTGRGLE